MFDQHHVLVGDLLLFEDPAQLAEKILRLLGENDGYLPYNDKSSPEEIYAFFHVSKKTFKMTLGGLYKQKKIEFTTTGIKLISS